MSEKNMYQAPTKLKYNRGINTVNGHNEHVAMLMSVDPFTRIIIQRVDKEIKKLVREEVQKQLNKP